MGFNGVTIPCGRVQVRGAIRIRMVLFCCLFFVFSKNTCFSQHYSDSVFFSQNSETNANVFVSDASDPPFPLKKLENPWGCFPLGTWVVRRTNRWHSAEKSVANNVMDTLLTLESVDENRITLRQETAIGIGNSVFTPEPKQIFLDFHLQPFSMGTEGTKMVPLQPQTVTVARRQVVCQVSQYTQILGNQKKVTTHWHSDSVMPYLLRSEEIRTTVPLSADHPESVVSHTIMMVTDTSGGRLFKNLLSDYKTQTIKKTATGTTISQASHSMNIPGGLLREVTVETDNTNRIIGRSVTSVLDYFVACLGVPIRQRKLYSEASREIQENWDNTTNQHSIQTLE
jgi:hypothetical protein